VNLYRGTGGYPSLEGSFVELLARLEGQDALFGGRSSEKQPHRSRSIYLEVIEPFWVYAQSSTEMVEGEKEILFAILSQSTSPLMMTIGRDVFITSTPADFHHSVPSRRASCTSIADRQQEAAEEDDTSSDQQENHVPVNTHKDLVDFQTVKRVLVS
jgi:hypothetical protein